MKKKILISTGGSGGHVVPASIIYDHLKNDFDVLISTDKRGIKFLNIENYKIKLIDTPQLNNNFFLLPIKIISLFFLLIKSIFLIKKDKIEVVISTGGYMSLPLCFAAKIYNIKIYLFEPNMVLGRTNKFFLTFCEKIFCYSEKIKNFPIKYLDRIICIEPLLRKEFYSFKVDENQKISDKINLLIIGGSQGAKLFDTAIRNTILNLSKKYELKIFHQTNIVNFRNLTNFYNQNNIKHQLFDYENDFLKLIKNINLCITRAGASTLSELNFLNIPYLAIPFLLAKDNHQFENALFYKNHDCCWLLEQNNIENNELTNCLLGIINNKEDYLNKKKNMKKISYQNTWNKINQKLIDIINGN
jgi:UDP-N-acetylglucosamine--N-acetylmuramyl-(pentapeptide) pyrophosphoryl-undecaprenol N-acetylglucosamine transferase